MSLRIDKLLFPARRSTREDEDDVNTYVRNTECWMLLNPFCSSTMNSPDPPLVFPQRPFPPTLFCPLLVLAGLGYHPVAEA